MNQSLHIIILAAGKGTRMRSTLPKVLHHIGGQPLLQHVIQTSQLLQPQMIHVIYGEGGDLVKHQLQNFTVNWIEQKEQLGTGHAVQQVLPYLSPHVNNDTEIKVVILYGDVPLITPNTLDKLLEMAHTKNHAVNLITTRVDDPSGYGRIERNLDGQITAIIEDKDATPEQRQIKEINSGILQTTAATLLRYLPLLEPHNIQGEYYLTDLISLAIADGQQIGNICTADNIEVLGINTKNQLAHLERCYQKRWATKLMTQGITLIDPARFDVRGNLTVQQDVIIDVNVICEGTVTIGKNSTIGANSFLKDVQIGNNVEVKANCVIEGAVIEDNCVIGPFARIRPQSHIANGAHVGNFVEVKKTIIGKNSKANHLTYLGDTIIGEQVNVGAGTITCNYDGLNKFQTIIEDGAFIGSGTQLIAPVKIGKNATIAAGSAINYDAPAGKLTLTRAPQVTLENWQRPTKGQTKTKIQKDTQHKDGK